MSSPPNDEPADAFLGEIGRQPAAMVGAARALAGQLDELGSLARRTPGGRLVLTGMGSSFDAGHVLVTSLAESGIPVQLVNAAELLHFGTSTLDPRSTVVIVSQSGRSVEVVRLLERIAERRERPFVVAVTNGRANPLAAGADLAFDTAVGDELGPATMTFAASLVVLDALGRVLAAGATADVSAICAQVGADAEGASAAIDGLLSDRRGVAATMVDWVGGRRNIVILGRGVARAAADMASLTIKEVSGTAAESLITADFRHGPLELVGEDLAVAFVALEPATASIDRAFAAELNQGLASVLVIGEGGEAAAGEGGGGRALAGARSIAIGPVDRRLAPAVGVVPFQLLARELAIARGRQPGEFGFASKVTTRE
jgi:glutamine---fructose-6-phosphate transaminase (isomerizing)